MPEARRALSQRPAVRSRRYGRRWIPRPVGATSLYAYDVSEWHDLFVAMAGATAALAGLLFVAISINLGEILKSRALPARAASALATLIIALVASTFALVPGQSRTVLGTELLVVCGLAGVLMLVLRATVDRSDQTALQYLGEFAMNGLAVLPFAIAGASLIVDRGGGLYWTVPGLVCVFFAAAINAWVLLVEIMR
jgi:modulator of FtsH protease